MPLRKINRRGKERKNLPGLDRGVVSWQSCWWLTVELLMVHDNYCPEEVLVWEV
jgi:hypothetical protein